MTKYERERIAAEIERQNAKADSGADKLLDKLKASNWTWLILGFAITSFLIALFF